MSLRQQNTLCKKVGGGIPQPQIRRDGLGERFSEGNDSFSFGSIVATSLLTLGYLLRFVGKGAAGLGMQRFACVG